jgi:hypothetical protein
MIKHIHFRTFVVQNFIQNEYITFRNAGWF